MLTVKKLRKILDTMDENAIIHSEQCDDFCFIEAKESLLLSTTKPIGHCNRSGEYVYPSVVRDYTAFSPALDEDLYDIEWTKLEEGTDE